jgi:hypothetical protein
MEICPKCKSNRIVPTRVLDRAEGGVEVCFDEKPDALFFKNRTKSGVFAQVCGSCGFIELYAFNPDVLYDAFQAADKKIRSK